MPVNIDQLILKLSRLKHVPLEIIIRNAARDFAAAALKATPLAAKTKTNLFFVYKNADSKEKVTKAKGGGPLVISADSVAKEKQALKGRSRASKALGRNRIKRYSKIRINSGYAKSTWIGVFRALGIPERAYSKANRYRHLHVDEKGTANILDMSNCKVVASITDTLMLDKKPGAIEQIRQAGYAKAASIMINAVKSEMKKLWTSQN